MKKLALIALALVIALFATCAMAETRSYALVGVQTADGTVVTAEELENFPVLAFVCDDESMTCAFGTEEEAVGGTFTTEEVEGGVVLYLTLEDGEELTLIYVTDEDSFSYVDEEGYVYVMVNVEELEAAA